MRARIHRFPVSNCCNKKLESNNHVSKQKINVTSSINLMVIRYGGKSHRVAV